MAGSPKKRARRAAAQAAAAAGDPISPEFRRKAKRPGTDQTWEEWRESRTEQQQLVDVIVAAMSNGSWLPGVSGDKLAQERGIAPSRVASAAKEAGLALRALNAMSPEFKEACRNECLQTFRIIRAMAISKAAPGTNPNPAACLGVALNATRLFGLYTGVEPARSTEAPVEADPFAGWTDAEVEEFGETGRRPKRQLVALASSGRELKPDEVEDLEAEGRVILAEEAGLVRVSH